MNLGLLNNNLSVVVGDWWAISEGKWLEVGTPPKGFPDTVAGENVKNNNDDNKINKTKQTEGRLN